MVEHKNNAPKKAITGLIDVDPLSSLKRSIIQVLNFIIL
jgi:hypothetical protein